MNKCCPKSVHSLTSRPKFTKKINLSVKFMHGKGNLCRNKIMHRIGQALLSILCTNKF